MNSQRDATPTLAAYLDNLLIQLRLLDVPGDRIGQILAEVETHVADTGLDPVVAFRSPRDYAATYAVAAFATPSRGRSGSWLRNPGVAGIAAVGGSAMGLGAVHLTGSVDLTARLLGTVLATVAIGLVVVQIIFGLLAVDTAGSLKPREFSSRHLVFGWLAMMAGVAGLVALALLPTGPTLMSLPGWALLAAGMLTFFALVRHLGGDRVVDPRG